MSTLRRPVAVTIVSWLLLIASIFIFIFALFILTNPDKMAAIHARYGSAHISMQYNLSLLIIAPCVNFAVGIGLLCRGNWARHVFLMFNALIAIIELITVPSKILVITSIIIYLIVLFFLYNKPASEYFTGTAPLE